jgi:hypothetical protein
VIARAAFWRAAEILRRSVGAMRHRRVIEFEIARVLFFLSAFSGVIGVRRAGKSAKYG